MIVTLTLNPAIDKTLTLMSFNLKQMNRVISKHEDPGGKGINVSKVIQALGGQSLTMGIFGGPAGRSLLETLINQKLNTDPYLVEEETRTNLKVFCQEDQQTFEINEPGPMITEEDLSKVTEKVLSHVTQGTWVVIAGSVPPGVTSAYYETLIKACKKRGARVFFDADGDLFKQGIKSQPDCIKPNAKELEAYFAKKMASLADYKACAAHFLDLGVKHVIISLGAEGALYFDKQRSIKAHPLIVKAHSSVGAGDAFVGACVLALEQGWSIDEMLRLAVATSAGAVETIGTKAPDLSWVNARKSSVILEDL